MDSSTFEPIFIVGCHRSGTTLLSVLCDRHSKIAVTPETYFFSHCVPGDGREQDGMTREDLIDRFFSYSYTHHSAGDLDVDRTKLTEEFKQYPARYKYLLQAGLTVYARKNGKDRPAEKTPAHIRHVPLILEWFPSAQIVCVVRDGRDVFRSTRRVKGNRLRKRLIDLFRIARSWNVAAVAAINMEKKYKKQVRRVRFEDLVISPEETLRQIDEFLGVPFEEGQLDTNRGTGVVLERETELKGKAKTRVDASRAYAWRDSMVDREKWLVNAIMGKYLRSFGYEDTGLNGCPFYLRVKLITTARIGNLVMGKGILDALRWITGQRRKGGSISQRTV